MTAALRKLLTLSRRLHFLSWSALLRLRLAWRGMRLELDAPAGALLASFPRVDVHGPRRGGGVLRLEVGRDVQVGAGVEIGLDAERRNTLTLHDDVQVSSGARFKLRGGSIELGPRALVRDFAVLKSSGDLSVGAGSTVSYGAVVHCAEAVMMGAGVGLAEHTTVVDSDHRIDGRDLSWEEFPIECDPVMLDRNTTILAHSTVLKGTRTGPGCVAAANSVLRGSYPGGSLVAGAPAKVVRSLTGGDTV